MKSLIAALFVVSGIVPAFSATGFYDYFYVITSLNGGSNTFNQVTTGTTPGDGAASGYNLASDGVNPAFLSFGTLTISDTLTLKGFEYKTWNDNSSSVTFANLYWRVYATGSPSGSFAQIQSNTPVSINGNNKTWQVLDGSTNILSGLASGNYTLEIYTESYTNGINTAGNIFGFSSGSNPTATFSVVPEPRVWALFACGLAATLIFRQRRPSR